MSNVRPLTDHEEALIAAVFMGGDPLEPLRLYEINRGRQIATAGMVDYLPLADWKPDSFVSLGVRPYIVRAVVLDAVRPGTGAFTRLAARIAAMQNVTLHVVSPTREFRAMLQRRGWRDLAAGKPGSWESNVWAPPEGS